jgi:Lsr2
MAQRVQITLLCDLDDGNVEADETLQFGLGDASYEVDVCGKHAQQVRDGLQPFVAHARKTSPASSSSRRRPERGVAGRDQTAGVRAWAKDTGIHVNDRGRIPASVVKEYEAAH